MWCDQVQQLVDRRRTVGRCQRGHLAQELGMRKVLEALLGLFRELAGKQPVAIAVNHRLEEIRRLSEQRDVQQVPGRVAQGLRVICIGRGYAVIVREIVLLLVPPHGRNRVDFVPGLVQCGEHVVSTQGLVVVLRDRLAILVHFPGQ